MKHFFCKICMIFMHVGQFCLQNGLYKRFLKGFLKEALMSHLSTHVTNSKMLFEAKNDYFHYPSQIQLCLIMLSKVYRTDFELTVPIFHNRLTFDEDLLENAVYKGFLKYAFRPLHLRDISVNTMFHLSLYAGMESVWI